MANSKIIRQAIEKAAQKDLKTLGGYIKRTRQRKKLSRHAFGRLCFLTGSRLKQIEEGKTGVQFLTLLKLSKAMEMDVVTMISIVDHRRFDRDYGQ